jgi:glyoxylase-like metal-dependent hydrolase (beta-lactamase superfamily II)
MRPAVNSQPHVPTTLALGPIRVDSILDGHMGVVPHVLYPRVTAREWAGRAGGHLDTDGNVPLDYGGFLARGPGGRVILVDTGGGSQFASVAGKSVLYAGHRLLDSLAGLSIAPQQITDVVFTHLHFDHCGWASRDGEPTFPRAAYWCHEADWRAFVEGSADERVRDAMLPVAVLARMWSEDVAVTPWLRLVHCAGHSPGNAIVLIDGGGRSLALIGDLAHHPLEFEQPRWHGGVDWEPAAAAEQRIRWFGRFADEAIMVASPHFPGQRPVRVRRDAAAFRCAAVAE